MFPTFTIEVNDEEHLPIIWVHAAVVESSSSPIGVPEFHSLVKGIRVGRICHFHGLYVDGACRAATAAVVAMWKW